MRIFEEVDHLVVETLEGQAMELGWVRDNDLTVTTDDYLRLVLKKTAWYSFIHPLRIGALVADGDDRNLGRFDRFGYLLGVAFQITDDVLNLNGNVARYGKEINGDLWEGKRTLLLTHAFGSGEQRGPSVDQKFSGAAARAPPAARGAAAARYHRQQRKHRVGASSGDGVCGRRGARVRQLGIRWARPQVPTSTGFAPALTISCDATRNGQLCALPV